MTDLDQLLRCPHIAKDLAIKACLRRQVERRIALVTLKPAIHYQGRASVRVPAVTQRVDQGPVHPECEGCEVGRATREAAGVPALVCEACGSALIAGAPCATCAERLVEAETGPARGFLPPPATGSPRIWSGEVPDVPLGPPPPQIHDKPAPNWTFTGPVVRHAAERPSLDVEAEGDLEEIADWAEAVARSPALGVASSARPSIEGEKSATRPAHDTKLSRLALPREDAMRHAGENPAPSPAHPAPAEPEEAAMACPECKSKTIHKASCSRRPGGPNGRPLEPAEIAAGKTGKPAAAFSRTTRPGTEFRISRDAERTLEALAGPSPACSPPTPLDAQTVDQLVLERRRHLVAADEIDAELRRRQEVIRLALSDEPRELTADAQVG